MMSHDTAVPLELFIDGVAIPGRGADFEKQDPSWGGLVACGGSADAQQVAAAMAAARSAHRAWSDLEVADRETILLRYANHLMAHQDEMATLITRETGKLRSEALAEVSASAAKVAVTIEAFHARRGNVDRSHSDDLLAQVRYQSLGVVLVLGPYNFPLHLPGGQIIPALLAGNTIVFKPSELASAVGQRMVIAWQEAGLPSGVINLLHGAADVAITAIDDPNTNGIFFTGGRSAGLAIHRQLAGRPEVNLALELGGNNPLVVAPPFEIEQTLSWIISSAYASSGQRCTCARRLILIDDESTDELLQELIARVSAMTVGPTATEPQPDIGPLVSGDAAMHVLQQAIELIDRGGKALVRPQVIGRGSALVHPGLLDMTGVKDLPDEECFGPILQCFRVADADAATRLAAATRYGLAAGWIGGTEEQFNSFRSRCGAGIVNWNCPITGASGQLPFGGLGQSGNHRPAGYFAIDACSDPVASLVRRQPGSQFDSNEND